MKLNIADDSGGEVEVKPITHSCKYCKTTFPLWSSTPPTVPGWYWCRTEFKTTAIVNLYDSFGDIYVAWSGNTNDSKLSEVACVLEWCGPITPPE